MSVRLATGAVLPLERMKPHDLLGRLAPFVGTPEERLADLARAASRRSFARGAAILRQGCVADRLYVVLRGRVHVTRALHDARALIVTTLGPGDTLGESCVCKGEVASTSGICATPVEALHIPALSLTACLMRDPATTLRLLALQSRRLREVETVASHLALCDVEERLAYTLARLAARQGRPGAGSSDWSLAPVPTRAELAHMLGTCRETVSRALGALTREGLVRGRGRRIVVAGALMEGLTMASGP